MKTLRHCNEPGCLELAQPGWSKCEPHGKAAVERGRQDRLAEAEAERDRINWQVSSLAEMFGVDTDAIDALTKYIRSRS